MCAYLPVMCMDRYLWGGRMFVTPCTHKLPTHSTHSDMLRTGSSHPQAIPSSHFNTIPRHGGGQVLRGVMLHCWMVARNMTGWVLMWFISALVVYEGMCHWWSASEVLWRWDSCCKAAPCSHALTGSIAWAVAETLKTYRRTLPLDLVPVGKLWGSRILFLPQGLCC